MRVLIVLFAALLASAQQTPEVLLHQDFETDNTVWSAVGLGSSVSITHQPGQAHSGNGTLAFSYRLKARTDRRRCDARVARPRPDAALAILGQDRSRYPAAVLLSETKPGGGNYTAWFWAPANTWQQIDLSPADFVLSDGPQDQGPRWQTGSRPTASRRHSPPGVALRPDCAGRSAYHWIDDFEALGGPSPTETSSMVIDSFDRGFVPWITSGVMNLKLAAPDNPLHEPALEASYDQTDSPPPVLLRRIGNHDLSKAVRLDFHVASDEESWLQPPSL